MGTKGQHYGKEITFTLFHDRQRAGQCLILCFVACAAFDCLPDQKNYLDEA